MASTIANLAVSLTAKSDGFTKGMRGAKKELTGFQSIISATKSNISGFIASMTGPAGMAAAVAGVGVAAWKTKAVLDEMAGKVEMIRGLGDSVQGFTELEYAAAAAGLKSEQFAAAMEKMVIKLGEAREGGAGAATTLAKLGLNVSQLLSMTPSESFAEIADKLSQVRNTSDRAAAAVDIFGKSGAKLLPILAGGKAGLAEMAEEARKFGAVITEEGALSVEKYDIAMDKLAGKWKGVWQSLALDAAPLLTGLATQINDVNTSVANSDNTKLSLFKEILERPISGTIEATLAALADLTGGLDNFELTVPSSFTPATSAVNQFADSMDNAATSAKGLADVIVPALTAQERLANRLAVTVEELGRLQSKASEAFTSTRTPTEQFQTDLKDLTRLYAMGLINLDTLNRASSAKLDQLFPKPNASGLPTLSDIRSPSYIPTGNTPLTSNYLTRSPGAGNDKALVDIGRAQLNVLKTTQQSIRELVRQSESSTQEVDL